MTGSDVVATVGGAVGAVDVSGAADVVGVVVVAVVVDGDSVVVADSSVVVLVASVPSLEHAVSINRVIEHAAARRRGDADW